MKMNQLVCRALVVFSFLAFASTVALADQIDTTSTIEFSDTDPVAGDPVTITGHVECTGVEHACPSPIGGTIQIQECMSGGVGVPAADCPAVGTWTTIDSGAPDGSGDFATVFDTTGLGGSTIGFRSHYVTPGGGHAPATGSSPGLDLVILSPPECTGVTVGAELASGDGTPAPGSSGPWTFRILVHACEDAAGVTAQGGTNGWAPMTGFAQSTGSVTVRSNKKNQVLHWDIGDMAAGTEAEILVTVDGLIPATALCDSVRFLSGPWSATFSTDGGVSFEKSEYAGRVSVVVTCG